MVQGVQVRVVSQAEWSLKLDSVDQVPSQANESDLEDCVVERDPVQEEVHVSGQEHHQVDLLRSVRQFFD